jgi:hypothetical protein
MRLSVCVAGCRAKGMTSMTPEVAAVLARYPPILRARLAILRRLIIETAAATQGVGVLEETLKWGQPSYLTSETKTGSTIRIDRVKNVEGRYALYVHCQTDLIETFRELYPDAFRYDGKRAIVFDESDAIDEAALGHCIALALTYHLRKKQAGR